MRLLLSIISYRTADPTVAAAQSACEALGNREARIAIVENASEDGSSNASADSIQSTGSIRMMLVRAAEPLGFSVSHNQGWRWSLRPTSYLILNFDALFRPGFYDTIFTAAEGHPQDKLIALELEWQGGTPQISCFHFGWIASALIRWLIRGQ